jgi:hypothetical protein
LFLIHVETGFAQDTPPSFQGEDPHCPVIGLNPEASAVANKIEYRSFILFIVRVGIIYVFDKNNIECASRGPGGAGSVLLEGLTRHVRCRNENAAEVQMGGGSSDSSREILRAIHVRYRIVHQDGIEGGVKPEGPHVSLDKRTLRV